MPYQCPCGKRLQRSSCGRPLKSPCLRLFLSIRTLEPVSVDAKICGSCRGAYYDWKRRNPEFDGILSTIDGEMSYDDDDDVSVVDEICF